MSIRRQIHLGVWAIAEAAPLPSWFVAGSIWIGVGIIALVLGLWFLEEGVLYYQQQPLITPYVRTWTSRHIVLGFIAALALVTLVIAGVTHFILDR